MEWTLTRLNCRSAYLTPGSNSRLWSRLCWAVASDALPGLTLEDWFASYEAGDPLVVVGDLIPEVSFPVPAMYRASRWNDEPPVSLPYPVWEEVVRSGRLQQRPPTSPNVHAVERTHVSLSRSTGRAAEGALYSQHGWYAPGGFLLFALVDDLIGIDGFRQLLEAVCLEGWGARRNVGYGEISIETCEPVVPPSSTAFAMTLGHIHPTPELPTEGWWRWAGAQVVPHDPDTRAALIAPDRLTNHPLHRYHYTTMLEPGATFATGGELGREYFGSVLRYEVGETSLYHYGMAPLYPVATLEEA